MALHAFYIAILVLTTDFEITQGSPEFRSIPLDSGATFGTYACPSCHAYVYHTHSWFPQAVMPTAGTLDDTSWVQPRAHIYTKSKQPWVEIPEGIPQFPEMYEFEEIWPKDALERLGEIEI